MIGIPKPKRGGHRREKGRVKRRESAVVQSVREHCVARDGHCRFGPLQPDALYLLIGSCDGPSEWAHLHEFMRSKTRGMAPERRHTRGGSLMLCQRHHHAGYDEHKFDIEPRTSSGAEGVLRVRAGASTYDEEETH